MAKDPAMLWYWADWHSGTTTLSRFLKGCYMDLLHAQFNSGRLTMEEIKTVLGSDFGQAWPTLQKKFTVDTTGKYFNERLEVEKEKRAAFTASRRKNLESKTHNSNHIDHHTGNLMEDLNRNRNDYEVFGDKKEWFVSIKKVLAKDRVKVIFDLRMYFGHRGQLDSFIRAGMNRFDDFMKDNPANVFDNEHHLYNAFRKFHVEGHLKKLAGTKKKLTLEDIDR